MMHRGRRWLVAVCAASLFGTSVRSQPTGVFDHDLDVELNPLIWCVFLTDVNGSGTVDAGDQLEVTFNKPVVFGANWSKALVPNKASDTFGTRNVTVWSDTDSRSWHVRLGDETRLSNLETGCKVRSVAGVTDGIVDDEGRKVAADQYVIEEPLPDPGSMLHNLVVGRAITPITINAKPFKIDRYEFLGLPPGLSVTFSPLAGTHVVGTPTQTASGEIIIRAAPPFGLVATNAATEFKRETIARWSYVVRTKPLPAFGIHPDELGLYDSFYPGQILALNVITNDPLTPVSFTLGGIALPLMPGSTVRNPLVLLPDAVQDGDLVVTQGADTHNAGSFQIRESSQRGPRK